MHYITTVNILCPKYLAKWEKKDMIIVASVEKNTQELNFCE